MWRCNAIEGRLDQGVVRSRRMKVGEEGVRVGCGAIAGEDAIARGLCDVRQ